jgi:lipopolysaccharide transport system permease protein
VASLASQAFGLLRGQRGGLRLYQWIWLIACTLGALVIAAPRVLSLPLYFPAEAHTLLDTRRYTTMFDADGQPGPDLLIAMGDAREALRQRALARADVRFGSPTYDAQFVALEPGRVAVRARGETALEAKQLADAAAEELARQIRGAGGREILRNMLGWELWKITETEPDAVASAQPAPLTRFDLLLRNIIRLQAFPMSRAPEPISTPRTVEGLPPEELSDLARALEARYDLWTHEINARNASLDGACALPAGTPTQAREQGLRACAATDAAVATELEARDKAVARRQAINDTIRYVVSDLGATFDADAPSAAYREAAALPFEPAPRYQSALLAAAALVGLVIGGLGVLVDRRAGAMGKLRELWSYRAVLNNLVARDLLSRYKGSLLGFLWTQLSPLLMMLVFWLAFSTLFPSGVAMFPVFLLAGLLPWNMTNEAVVGGTQSVIVNSNLIKKHYFPREILPIASVVSSLINFLLSLPMLFVVMAAVQWLYAPLEGRLNFSWTFAFLPAIMLIQLVFLIGVCFFLSALAVFVRDTLHLVGILTQIWFFLTPVFYPLESVPNERLAQLIRWLNPMASLVEYYRGILYGTAVPYPGIPTPGLPALDSVLRSSVTALLTLALGYWFFRRMSGRFGEEI